MQKRRPDDYNDSVYPAQAFYKERCAQPSLYIAIIGVLESKGRYVHEQIASATTVHVIYDGKGVRELDGKPYTVQGGELFVVWPGQHIYCYDHPSTPWKYSWFNLEGSRAEWALNLTGLSRESPHCSVPSFREVKDHTQNL